MASSVNNIEIKINANAEAAKKSLGGFRDSLRALSNIPKMDFISDEELNADVNSAKKAFENLKNAGMLSAQDITKAYSKMNQAIRGVNEAGEKKASFTSQLDEFMGKNAGYIAALAAVAGGFVYVSKEASAFEAAMANVKKVVETTPQEFDALKNSILNLSAQIPITANDLSKIAAIGGQMNIPKEQLVEFTKLVAQMGVAFEVSAEDAGKALGSLSNIYKLQINDMKDLADVVNVLGNNMATNEKDILEVLNRVGGAAQVFGLAKEEAAALAATFLSMGQPAEMAGTSINALLSKLQAANEGSADFKAGLERLGLSAAQMAKMVNDNPQKALTDFLATLNTLDKQTKAEVLSQVFGLEYADNLALLTTGLDEYGRALTMSADKLGNAGSAQKEFATKAQTTEAQMQILKNTFNKASIELGSTFLPAINLVLKGLGDFITMLSDATKATSNFVSSGIDKLVQALPSEGWEDVSDNLTEYVDITEEATKATQAEADAIKKSWQAKIDNAKSANDLLKITKELLQASLDGKISDEQWGIASDELTKKRSELNKLTKESAKNISLLVDKQIESAKTTKDFNNIYEQLDRQLKENKITQEDYWKAIERTYEKEVEITGIMLDSLHALRQKATTQKELTAVKQEYDKALKDGNITEQQHLELLKLWEQRSEDVKSAIQEEKESLDDLNDSLKDANKVIEDSSGQYEDYQNEINKTAKEKAYLNKISKMSVGEIENELSAQENLLAQEQQNLALLYQKLDIETQNLALMQSDITIRQASGQLTAEEAAALNNLIQKKMADLEATKAQIEVQGGYVDSINQSIDAIKNQQQAYQEQGQSAEEAGNRVEKAGEKAKNTSKIQMRLFDPVSLNSSVSDIDSAISGIQDRIESLSRAMSHSLGGVMDLFRERMIEYLKKIKSEFAVLKEIKLMQDNLNESLARSSNEYGHLGDAINETIALIAKINDAYDQSIKDRNISLARSYQKELEQLNDLYDDLIAKSKEAGRELKDIASGIRQDLLAMQGYEKQLLDIEYRQKRQELEGLLKDATASGDTSAMADYQQAISDLDSMYKSEISEMEEEANYKKQEIQYEIKEAQDELSEIEKALATTKDQKERERLKHEKLQIEKELDDLKEEMSKLGNYDKNLKDNSGGLPFVTPSAGGSAGGEGIGGAKNINFELSDFNTANFLSNLTDGIGGSISNAFSGLDEIFKNNIPKIFEIKFQGVNGDNVTLNSFDEANVNKIIDILKRAGLSAA